MYKTEKYQTNCLAKSHCDYAGDACKVFCKKCYALNYLISTSGIGKVYLKGAKLRPEERDLETFKRLKNIKDNMKEFVAEGQNLVIKSSTCGNGKTSWATKLLLNYYLQICEDGLLKDALFVGTKHFLMDMKEAIGTKDPKIKVIMRRLEEANLVVWDDMGSDALTEYEYDLIWQILDKRLQKGLSNIYTMNCTDETLLNNIGQRLNSRILSNSIVMVIIGADRRCPDTKW